MVFLLSKGKWFYLMSLISLDFISEKEALKLPTLLHRLGTSTTPVIFYLSSLNSCSKLISFLVSYDTFWMLFYSKVYTSSLVL